MFSSFLKNLSWDRVYLVNGHFISNNNKILNYILFLVIKLSFIFIIIINNFFNYINNYFYNIDLFLRNYRS